MMRPLAWPGDRRQAPTAPVAGRRQAPRHQLPTCCRVGVGHCILGCQGDAHLALLHTRADQGHAPSQQ